MARKEFNKSVSIVRAFRVKEMFSVSGEAMKIIFSKCPHATEPSYHKEDYKI